MIMTMIVVNIHQAKAKLSEYVDAAARGERVLICNRNRPVAELRAVEPRRTQPRPIGGGPYEFSVGEAFFAPMPDEWIDALETQPAAPAMSTARRARASKSRPGRR
jgi:prevent-host-death family protein